MDDGYDALIAKQRRRACCCFEQHYALPRRNVVHQAPGGGVCKARQFHIYHIGQYLPDLAPMENYYKTF